MVPDDFDETIKSWFSLTDNQVGTIVVGGIIVEMIFCLSILTISRWTRISHHLTIQKD